MWYHADVDCYQSPGEMSNADEDALRAIRAASPALQEWWPDGEMSPRSWHGVMWGDDRVQRLDLSGSEMEVLAPQVGQLQALIVLDLQGCPLKELPPQLGLLQALAHLDLRGCQQLTLAPGAEVGQPAQTTVAAYARLLIVDAASDAAAAAKGLNDNAHGIDRFGYGVTSPPLTAIRSLLPHTPWAGPLGVDREPHAAPHEV